MKTAVHFTDKYLLQPTNPIRVNLIGAGGTGSQMLTALARMNHSLRTLGHAGLQLHVYDDDIVTNANLGRQLFSPAELGLNKGVALINRVNRFFGFNWKAVPMRYGWQYAGLDPEHHATLTVSCVDTVAARFEIARVLQQNAKSDGRNAPLYWCDCGNARYTGQVSLATVKEIRQPASKKFEAVGSLPFITEEYKRILERTDETNVPSCSLAEALLKQDLFINSAISTLAASLLWQLFREGMIENRGFFMNLKNFRSQPIKITAAQLIELKGNRKRKAA